MVEENMNQQFKLETIDKARNYLIESIRQS